MADNSKQTYLILAEAVVLGAGSAATYLYRGGIVPAGVATDEQIKHHLAIKAIEPIDLPDPVDVVAVPEGDPVEAWSIAEFDAWAAAQSPAFEFGSAKTKADRLKAIADARTAQ